MKSATYALRDNPYFVLCNCILISISQFFLITRKTHEHYSIQRADDSVRESTTAELPAGETSKPLRSGGRRDRKLRRNPSDPTGGKKNQNSRKEEKLHLPTDPATREAQPPGSLRRRPINPPADIVEGVRYWRRIPAKEGGIPKSGRFPPEQEIPGIPWKRRDSWFPPLSPKHFINHGPPRPIFLSKSPLQAQMDLKIEGIRSLYLLIL